MLYARLDRQTGRRVLCGHGTCGGELLSVRVLRAAPYLRDTLIVYYHKLQGVPVRDVPLTDPGVRLTVVTPDGRETEVDEVRTLNLHPNFVRRIERDGWIVYELTKKRAKQARRSRLRPPAPIEAYLDHHDGSSGSARVVTRHRPELPARIACPRCGTDQVLDRERLRVLSPPYELRMEPRGDG
jgi:hypothetical protein